MAEISFTQAALGTRVNVPTLEGESELTIKPGAQPGDVLRLKGLGIPNLRGFGRGSQLVVIRVKTPTSLSRKERNLLKEFARLRGEDV